MQNIVVGLGEILWDIFPDRKVLGGAPANFAYHASQFGCNSCVVSAIGNDLLGKEIIGNLDDKKLNYLLNETDYPTGTINISLDNKGVPQYNISENAAWDNIPFMPKTEDIAKNTKVVSFGSLAQRNPVSRKTILSFLELMPNDSLKIYDINLRQHYYSKDIIQQSLQLANILKINDEEIIEVAKLFDYEDCNEQDLCKKLLNLYKLNIVILTKGANGSFVFSGNDTFYQATPTIKVADTVGAGDSFTAAFVASYINGKPIADAHKLAVEVSAYVCTQHGAMPQLPSKYKVF